MSVDKLVEEHLTESSVVVDDNTFPKTFRAINTMLKNGSYQTRHEYKIKIPLKMTDADIKRFDKMIVYFNEQNERALVEMVQILYHENDTVFFAPGARFGAAVPNSSGRPMRGVAFGEDPGISHESFGGIRAKILAEVYTRALSEKISFNATPAIVRLFQDACRAHHVDPSHAAFNDDKKTFPYIRSLQRAIERASSR
jgi:hypothetical protein